MDKDVTFTMVLTV